MLYNESLSVLALPLSLRVASANGVTIDRVVNGNAYENVLVVVLAGTITDGTQTVVIQGSDDGTTWVNTPAANQVGTIPALAAGNSNTVFDVGLASSRRFIRVNVTVGGAPATGGTIGAVAVLADPSYLPAR